MQIVALDHAPWFKAIDPDGNEWVYGIRTNRAGGGSSYSFKWAPYNQWSTALDWIPSSTCGNGLHFLPWAKGNSKLVNWDPDPKVIEWRLVRSLLAETVPIDDQKTKARRCFTLKIGTKEEVIAALVEIMGITLASNAGLIGATLTGGNHATLTGGDDATLTGGYGATLTGGDDATLTGGNHATLTGGYGATLTGGDDATLTGGYGATLTGGYGATLTGGNHATLTGGDDATLTGGDDATLTGGYGATLTGGDDATLTGGYGATLTGGYGATLTGGDGATLTGGDDATLTGGYGATLTGGYGATVTVGENGYAVLKWWDSKNKRARPFILMVGEEGIKPNTKYTLNLDNDRKPFVVEVTD